MMTCFAQLVLTLAAFACACDGRLVMMTGARDASPSHGAIAMVDRDEHATADKNMGSTGDPKHLLEPISTVEQHGSFAVSDNACPTCIHRSLHRSSDGSGNSPLDRTGVHTLSYTLKTRTTFALLHVPSNTNAVKCGTRDVIESRPLSLLPAITAVAFRAKSGVVERSSSSASQFLISGTTVMRATTSDSVLKTPSLPQVLASKTSSDVLRTSSRLQTAKKVVTSATIGVPKSFLTPQRLSSKTTKSHTSKSSQLLVSKMSKTRATSDEPAPPFKYLSWMKKVVTTSGTTSGVTKSQTDLTLEMTTMRAKSAVLKSLSISTSRAPILSAQLVPNTLDARTTGDVLKSSSKLTPAKKVVTSVFSKLSLKLLTLITAKTRVTSGIPVPPSKHLLSKKVVTMSATTSGVSKLSSSSQTLASKTCSIHATSNVSKSSLLVSKISVTSGIPESSSPLLTAKTRFGCLGTRKRSSSRKFVRVRRVKKKVTPRCGTRFDQTKVYSDRQSRTCITPKCDLAGSKQDSMEDSGQDPLDEPFSWNEPTK